MANLRRIEANIHSLADQAEEILVAASEKLKAADRAADPDEKARLKAEADRYVAWAQRTADLANDIADQF